MTLAIHALALPFALFAPALQGTPPCEISASPVPLGLSVGFLDPVSVSEGTLLVEAEVYVDQGGSWQHEATLLTPETTSVGVSSCAIDGDMAVVGHALNDDMVTDGGSVEIFVRDGTGWHLEARLYAPSPEAEERFGLAVDIEGDLAIVGAPYRGVGGAAFVFRRSGTAWSCVGELEPSMPSANGLFGHHAAVSGDTALVAELEGDAFVFVDDGANWSEQAYFAPANVIAIDLCGDTAVVRRPASTDVLVREGSEWSTQATFEVADTSPFFRSVAVRGDVVAALTLGLPSDTVVEVHVRRGTSWTQLADVVGAIATTQLVLDGGRVIFADGLAANQLYEAELPSFVAPGVAHRNAGTNPDSYASTPAYIGQSLHFTIDLTTTGHDQALVFGFDSPFGLTLGGGQTLLCLDLLGSGGELIHTGFHPGPVAEIELPVPNLLALGGFEVSTQALHAFGTVPFALSNAQDLVIGACF